MGWDVAPVIFNECRWPYLLRTELGSNLGRIPSRTKPRILLRRHTPSEGTSILISDLLVECIVIRVYCDTLWWTSHTSGRGHAISCLLFETSGRLGTAIGFTETIFLFLCDSFERCVSAFVILNCKSATSHFFIWHHRLTAAFIDPIVKFVAYLLDHVIRGL